jgi:hypothetical protein
MDIGNIVKDLLEKFDVDEQLKEKFMKNPVETVKKLVGDKIPENQIDSIVEAVKAKLGVENVGEALGKLGKLFK